MKPRRWFWLVLLTVAVAGSLRLPRLSKRPLHTDEAVHAWKLGVDLMESGRYEYDPHEYHGPTLNAFTLPIAWLRGQASHQTLDEVTLRLVPALFGIGLVLLPLLFYDGLGIRGTGLAMFFTALSPAFVFYSRYYIQEVLLVFFTLAFLGCLWRYIRSMHWGWLILTGISAGLMHATKETCIISFGSVVLAGGILFWLERPQLNIRLRWWHPVLVLGVALGVSELLFSWFFTHPRGIVDSFATYAIYFNRAGQGEGHTHPWYYYLDLLTWIEGFEWPGWNEDYTVVVAALGMGYAFFKRDWPGGNLLLVRFLALYTFLMTTVYSALPYKTPWSMLGCLSGMLLLAAVGTDAFLRTLTQRWEKIAVSCFVLLFGLLSPLIQSVLLNFKYETDQTNPYVYAHTHRDIFRVCDTLRQYATFPGDPEPLIQVVCPQGDCWPLPWYLRDLSNIGYPPQLEAMDPVGDVVVTQPNLKEALHTTIYERGVPGERELYMAILPEGTQLRHGVELLAYARMSLWEKVRNAEAPEVLP